MSSSMRCNEFSDDQREALPGSRCRRLDLTRAATCSTSRSPMTASSTDWRSGITESRNHGIEVSDLGGHVRRKQLLKESGHDSRGLWLALCGDIEVPLIGLNLTVQIAFASSPDAGGAMYGEQLVSGNESGAQSSAVADASSINRWNFLHRESTHPLRSGGPWGHRFFGRQVPELPLMHARIRLQAAVVYFDRAGCPRPSATVSRPSLGGKNPHHGLREDSYMSIVNDPQPSIPQTLPPDVAGNVSSTFAVLALIAGIVAFLSGWIPVWGLIAGGAAIALAAFAMVKKQRKPFALAGLILGGVAVLTSLITTVALIGGIAGASNSNTALAPAAMSTSSPAPKVTAKPTSTPKPTAKLTPSSTPTPAPTVAPAPPKPVESVSQSNASRKAQSYLSYTSFSRSGLIDQLVYEGFSAEDATYGADAAGADWAQQAAGKAKSYLEFSAFSREGLIDQLLFEGFSADEAEFGVSSVGL
jgi:Host cell surface-exposed lipoprotein